VDTKTDLDGRVKTHRRILKLAFAELRKDHGFIARMNFWCCQGCAWSAISQQIEKDTGKEATGKENIVFWHKQSDDAFDRDGNLKVGYMDEAGANSLHLYHQGDTQKVVDVINSYSRFGIQAVWDGNSDKAISVIPKVWCAKCGKGYFGVEPYSGSWAKLMSHKDQTKQVGWLCLRDKCSCYGVEQICSDGTYLRYISLPDHNLKFLPKGKVLS
jgi:hypothetical protein